MTLLIFVKSLQINFISLLCIVIILPFYNMPQETSGVKTIENNRLSPQISSQEVTNINLLFSYNPPEKNFITQVLNHYNPLKFHTYQNFPVGFVTLDEKMLPQIEKNYPDIYSRLHISQKIKVIPSLEQFNPQKISSNLKASYTPPSEVINANELWSEGFDGSNVKIAILDSGIDGETSHGAFEERIVYEESFVNTFNGFSSNESTHDYHGHGTHVAGIAAGAGTDYRGIAYKADLVNLKVSDMSGHSTPEAMLAAIDEAIIQRVDVISISIGFGKSSPWGLGDEITLAVDSAVDAGIVVVVAAGNEGTEDRLASIGSPASARKAITVGATNGSYKVASFSSRGPSFNYKVDPDIVAPGVQIIAPLAPGCLIELAYESLVNVELGNYLTLSGTSMSTPVVSGAVALLKQQFPEATPAAIRAALQESAFDMNEPLYTQGSGLLNVAEASAVLEDTENNEGFDLISSLPRAVSHRPVEFAERVAFPGDRAQMGISFVTGMEGTITWDISESIENFIEFDITNQAQSTSGYFEKSLNVSIPLNTAPGDYNGNISYSFRGNTHVIPLAFTIKNPKSNIYWDTHYTGKDDSSFYDYRALDDFLVSNLQFDINDYESSLTWQNLSQSDILVLSDLEYPISASELSFISKFHNQSGSILLVTSAFPYFNPDPYSKISEVLGLHIDFNDRLDLVNHTDDGRSREIVPLSPNEVELSWESGNIFFEGVDALTLRTGTAFKGDPTLKYQVQVVNSNHVVAAAYEQPNKGKVLILGSELWLQSPFLSTVDGQNFANNVFRWLKTDTGLTVQSRVSFIDRQLEISAYSSDESNLSANIIFSNGSSVLEYSLPYDTTLQHHRLVVTLGPEQNQKITITLKKETIVLKEYELFDISTLPEITGILINYSASSDVLLPSWADTDLFDSVIDQGINISLTHSNSSSIKSIVLISNQLEKTLDVINPPLDNMSEVVIEKQLLMVTDTLQSLSWRVPDNFTTGYYSIEIQIWFEIESNSKVLLKTERDFFYIPDPEPILDIKSTIRGHSLDFYRNMEIPEDIEFWNPGETIELRLIGQDDNSNEFKVHVQLIHYYLWFVDRMVLDYFEVPKSPTNESENIGSFIVPSDPIPLPDLDFNLEIDNQLFVLLIFIRDAQGNSDIEVIYFTIGSSLFIDFNLAFLFIFAVLAIAIIIGAVIFIQKRTRSQTSYYSFIDTYTSNFRPPTPEQRYLEKRYCHNCGAVVVPEAKFCGICGVQRELD